MGAAESVDRDGVQALGPSSFKELGASGLTSNEHVFDFSGELAVPLGCLNVEDILVDDGPGRSLDRELLEHSG